MGGRASRPRRSATTRPRRNATGGPGNAGIAPPDHWRVAAFGDSLMWGQGLNRTDRFTQLITRALPAMLGKARTGIVSADASRSGAQIRARSDQRTLFPDTFPSLFHGRRQQRRFIEGTDESFATGLYGEIPASFPTVRGQVALVSDAVGKTIDIALVDGGVNDIAVEDIINPAVSSGEFIERWDGQIRAVGHDDVLELIGRVRRKCPGAVIMYFGFFAPLSYRSSPNQIRAVFKHELDDDIGWWLNDVFGFQDVNAAILEAMTRAVWMQGRWQYWTRQAVVDANRTAAVRGPGVLFVPSGFTPENSVFAKSPFLHEDYIHPTTDPAQPERQNRCPRLDQLEAMQGIYDFATRQGGISGPLPPPKEQVKRLHDAIDGPLRLKKAMQDYRADGTRDNLLRMLAFLADEIGRIQRALVASVSHPNAAGAKSYADMAIARLKGHLAVTEAIDREIRLGDSPVVPAGGETLDAKLRRYRLRRAGPLQADAGHLDVDSLAVRVVTAADSDQNFFPDVWLIVTTKEANGRAGRRQYQLNFAYRLTEVPVVGTGQKISWVAKLYPHFEPGATNRFTVDTMGRLRLDEIVACALLVGGDRLAGLTTLREHGKVWKPSVVRLEVNGQEVVNLAPTGQQFGFLARLDLAYPAPAPNLVPPKLASVKIASVRPLAARRRAARRVAPPPSD
jgi:GDSL-like Lipase/Acylhydrolase family